MLALLYKYMYIYFYFPLRPKPEPQYKGMVCHISDQYISDQDLDVNNSDYLCSWPHESLNGSMYRWKIHTFNVLHPFSL